MELCDATHLPGWPLSTSATPQTFLRTLASYSANKLYEFFLVFQGDTFKVSLGHSKPPTRRSLERADIATSKRHNPPYWFRLRTWENVSRPMILFVMSPY